jgi:transposase
MTDEQSATLEPFIPTKQPRRDNKKRSWVSNLDVLYSILWVQQIGAAWQNLADRYFSPATCHRRFQEWRKEGVPENILQTLAKNLKECGKLDLSECFIDGFIVVAKKGAVSWNSQARQRYDDHGSGLPLWSPYCQPHFACC